MTLRPTPCPPRTMSRPTPMPARTCLVGPTALACLAALALAPGCSRPAPRHLVLISVDTLRADQLGSHGQRLATSPFFDRLVRQSVQFSNAISGSSWTGAAHMSLFTGAAPQSHGLVSYPFYARLDYRGSL